MFTPDADLSRIFGLDIDWLVATGFAWINLAFIILLLSWLLYKPVNNFLAARRERIANQIEATKKNLHDSEESKLLYLDRLAKIEAERAQILSDARKIAASKEVDVIEKANREADEIRMRAHRDITLKWQEARDNMRVQIIEVSSEMAGRLVGEYIDTAAATKERLLNQAIMDLGDVNWNG